MPNALSPPAATGGAMPRPGEEIAESPGPWKSIMVVCGLITALAACLIPEIRHQRRKAQQTSAVSSLRGIGFGLFEFEAEYGKFPDPATAAEIKRTTGSALTLSDRSSNDVFVQLLASGIVTSESLFDTHIPSTRKPDGDWSSDATALAHGETGFADVAGLSSKGNPSTPIVFGPIIPGTKAIDANAFAGKAVMLKLDNSVSSVPISSDGKIRVHGPDLLDPGNPIWDGNAPDIKWPK